MDVLDKIDEMRKARGWSVNNLAMEAMLTQSTLNNLYKRNSEPKLSTLRAICNAFGISLSEFFAYEDEERKQNDMRIAAELSQEIEALTPEQKEALLKMLKSIRK